MFFGVLLTLMAGCFLANLIFIQPSVISILEGIIPYIPSNAFRAVIFLFKTQ